MGVDTYDMGGSCLCEKEVADYIASEDWDAAILELGINMVRRFPVSEFEQRAVFDFPGAGTGEARDHHQQFHILL